ncbi:MAG: Coenzyme F420 hydrogenase/dehydrogenase, beta subunit C-terminal domain [Lachnospiraceae bacterium]
MTKPYQNKENCYGCGACVSLCSHNALSMQKDEDGFTYPVVDSDKCIQCGTCQKVCPARNTVQSSFPEEVYAASYKDAQSLWQSSSGGIFPAIAKYVLSQGGIVFGATMEEDFTVKTVSVHNLQELSLLQGSKYIQCNTGNMFSEIRELLAAGKTVLFCGTPCQVAGLKKATAGLDMNLILIDLVCHGVPSQQMFKDYISHLEGKKSITVKSYRFRDKKYGQDMYYSYTYAINGQEHTKCQRAAQSSFYRLYLEDEIFRESCYHCKFADSERVGDLTLSDYWGIEQEHPNFVRELKSLNLCGTSGVLVNTRKGKDIFEKISAELVKCPSDFQKLSIHNHCLISPSVPGSDRDKIFQLYREGGYRAVDDYYFSKYVFKILRGSIGSVIPLPLRKRINGLIRKGKK